MWISQGLKILVFLGGYQCLTSLPKILKKSQILINNFVIKNTLLFSLFEFNYFIKKQPPEMFYKKVFLEISQNSQENTSARASFLTRLQP